jgi:hypothetical protein
MQRARDTVVVGLILAVGCVGGLRAQDPVVAAPVPTPDPTAAAHVLADPVPGHYPSPGPGVAPVAGGPVAGYLPIVNAPGWPAQTDCSAPDRRRCLTWLRRPCGCAATLNSFTCGNLDSELTFIFGSCRQFYGEPCVKQQPIPAYPYADLWNQRSNLWNQRAGCNGCGK